MKIYWFYCFEDKGKNRKFGHKIIVANNGKQAWNILLGNSSYKESESVKKLKEEYKIEAVTDLNGESGEIACIHADGHVHIQKTPAKNRYFNYIT